MINVSWRVFLMYNLDARAVGDDFMQCLHLVQITIVKVGKSLQKNCTNCNKN